MLCPQELADAAIRAPLVWHPAGKDKGGGPSAQQGSWGSRAAVLAAAAAFAGGAMGVLTACCGGGVQGRQGQQGQQQQQEDRATQLAAALRVAGTMRTVAELLQVGGLGQAGLAGLQWCTGATLNFSKKQAGRGKFRAFTAAHPLRYLGSCFSRLYMCHCKKKVSRTTLRHATVVLPSHRVCHCTAGPGAVPVFGGGRRPGGAHRPRGHRGGCAACDGRGSRYCCSGSLCAGC